MARTSPARWLRVVPLVEALEAKEAPGSLSLGLLTPNSPGPVLHPVGPTAPSVLSRSSQVAEPPARAADALWQASLHPAWQWNLPVPESAGTTAPSRGRSRLGGTEAVFADLDNTFSTSDDLLSALDLTTAATSKSIVARALSLHAGPAGPRDPGSSRAFPDGDTGASEQHTSLAESSGNAALPMVPLIVSAGVLAAACDAARAEACNEPADMTLGGNDSAAKPDTLAADTAAASTTAAAQATPGATSATVQTASPPAGSGARSPGREEARADTPTESKDAPSTQPPAGEEHGSWQVTGTVPATTSGTWAGDSTTAVTVYTAAGAAATGNPAELPPTALTVTLFVACRTRGEQNVQPSAQGQASVAVRGSAALGNQPPVRELSRSAAPQAVTPVPTRRLESLVQAGRAQPSAVSYRAPAAPGKLTATLAVDARTLAAAQQRKARRHQDLEAWAGADRATLAIVFTDLVGSTALGCELGNDTMDEIRRAHFRRGRQLLEKQGGFEIKTLGDALMVAFRTAGAALNFALEFCADPGHPFLRLCAGLHVGPVRIEENDAFGTMVNYTARLVALAEPAQVWLSERARQEIAEVHARAHRDLDWTEHPDCYLKGFVGGQRLWSVTAVEAARE